MIVANAKNLADRAGLLRLHGSSAEYTHTIVGTNSRLDTLQAAVLLVKLTHLNQWTVNRQRHASIYDESLDGLAGLTLPYGDSRCVHVYNQYTIRTPKRDALQQFLSEKGIGTRVYYPTPLHLQRSLAFLGYKEGDFPESERAAREVVSIPVYPEMTADQQAYIVRCVHEFYR